jgi:hypothetical protein
MIRDKKGKEKTNQKPGKKEKARLRAIAKQKSGNREKRKSEEKKEPSKYSVRRKPRERKQPITPSDKSSKGLFGLSHRASIALIAVIIIGVGFVISVFGFHLFGLYAIYVPSGTISAAVTSFDGYQAGTAQFSGTQWNIQLPYGGWSKGTVLYGNPYNYSDPVQDVKGTNYYDLPNEQIGNTSYYERVYTYCLPMSVYTTETYTDVLGGGVTMQTQQITQLTGTVTRNYWNHFGWQYNQYGISPTSGPSPNQISDVHGYLPYLSGLDHWTDDTSYNKISGGFGVSLAADMGYSGLPQTLVYNSSSGTYTAVFNNVNAGIVSVTAINDSSLGYLNGVGQMVIHNIVGQNPTVISSDGNTTSGPQQGSQTDPAPDAVASNSVCSPPPSSGTPITNLNTWDNQEIPNCFNINIGTSSQTQGGAVGGVSHGANFQPTANDGAFKVPQLNASDPLATVGNYTDVAVNIPCTIQPLVTVGYDQFTYDKLSQAIDEEYSNDQVCKCDYYDGSLSTLSASSETGTMPNGNTGFPEGIGITQSYVTYALEISLQVATSYNWNQFNPYQGNSGAQFNSSDINYNMTNQDWDAFIGVGTQLGNAPNEQPNSGNATTTGDICVIFILAGAAMIAVGIYVKRRESAEEETQGVEVGNSGNKLLLIGIVLIGIGIALFYLIPLIASAVSWLSWL